MKILTSINKVFFRRDKINTNRLKSSTKNEFPLPSSLYLEITSECNYRCKHCHMWLNKEGLKTLNTDDKKNIINQFYLINPFGSVILSGGETMLKEEEFFTLSNLCRSKGLSSVAVTNGSMIREDNYERVLTEGPDLIVISLDSHIESIHDYLRGIKGSFNRTVKVLKEISELKSKKFIGKRVSRIYTNTVLFDKNISHINEYIDFARNLGIDGVLFQCLHETYKNNSKNGKDSFYKTNFFQNTKTAIDSIDNIISLHYKDKFVATDMEDFKWMKRYILNPKFTLNRQVCGSHEKNIIINSYGDYSLCFNMHELDEIENLNNTRNISLSEFWESSLTQNARFIMDKCRKNCGILACHRKDNVVI